MEIKNILKNEDFTLVVEYSKNLPNTPSRSKLEDVVQEAIGKTVPDNTVKYLVHSANDKWFLVYYVKDADVFLFEKLTAR